MNPIPLTRALSLTTARDTDARLLVEYTIRNSEGLPLGAASFLD